MALMDFQNHLFYMVVHTTNSILEMKKKGEKKQTKKTSVYVLRRILSLKKLDVSVNQPQ